MEVHKFQHETGLLFREHFGNTPLTARIKDIISEAQELQRFTDLRNLSEEAGDLGASLLALCHECGWDFEELVQATHAKIKRRAAQYKSLGRKVKVALLGGAFDPPTLGHIAVARFVLNVSKTFDEVWLVPCFRHMYNKRLSPTVARLEMCELVAAQDGRVRVFDFEITHQLRGETYNFVQRLLDDPMAQNEYDFSLIIGMDNANTFDNWVNFEELERMIRFVVVPRAGEKRNESVDWYLKPPHIYLPHDQSLPETSSTEVRELVGAFPKELARELLLKLVDPAVLAYIEKEGLYNSTE
jgi:nicotinate-nucleotide adenylyltransferase